MDTNLEVLVFEKGERVLENQVPPLEGAPHKEQVGVHHGAQEVAAGSASLPHWAPHHLHTIRMQTITSGKVKWL